MTQENKARQSWSEAGDRLGALGLKLKLHYEEARGSEEERQKEREELATAVERLTEVVKEAFDAVGQAAKDTAVRDDVKGVGEAVGSALSASFEDLRRAARR